MKIEPRGKYAGVKVHLDGDEAREFLDVYSGSVPSKKAQPLAVGFQLKLGKKIHRLIEEVPGLLEDRTEDQVKASMEKDLEKIHLQQAAIKKGKDWKGVG